LFGSNEKKRRRKMKNKKIVLLVGLVSLVFVTISYAVTVDEIIAKLEENQEKIKDMSADVVMEIDVAGKVVKQETKMWSKGEKTKIKMVNTEHPMTVIMGADKMTIKQAGKEPQMIDTKKISEGKEKAISQTPLGMDFPRGMGEFLRKSNVTITKEKGNEINLSVIPEESNPLMQKLDMVVDMARGIVKQQKMYSNMGISLSRMEYEKEDEVWVLKRLTTVSNFGKMGTSTTKAEYNNIRINKGIEDIIFTLEE
jgi:outer membrane lipoprotein-sorting protein